MLLDKLPMGRGGLRLHDGVVHAQDEIQGLAERHLADFGAG
jgi:hypothetical protein